MVTLLLAHLPDSWTAVAALTVGALMIVAVAALVGRRARRRSAAWRDEILRTESSPGGGDVTAELARLNEHEHAAMASTATTHRRG